MNIIHKIKYRFSEAYRIRIGCGLSAVRNDREYRAVLEFCRDQLKDEEHMRLNPDRKKVYETTLLLDKNFKEGKLDIVKFTLQGRKTAYYEPYDFIDDHVNYFWS